MLSTTPRLRRTAGAALFLLIMSGCADPAKAPETSVPISALRLDDLRQCSLKHEDGSPVACVNQAKVAAVGSSRPSGWLCIDRAGDPTRGAYLYRSPTGDRMGLWYVAGPISTPVSGALLIDKKPAWLYSWEAGPAEGWIELDAFPAQGSLDAYVFHAAYSTNRTDLSGGKLEQEWSMYQDAWWPLHRLAAGGNEYFFAGVAGNELIPIVVKGVDFEITIHYEKAFRATMEYSPTPTTSC